MMVEEAGFEPTKAEPSDLQSDPFNHSGTPPINRVEYDVLLGCTTYLFYYLFFITFSAKALNL